MKALIIGRGNVGLDLYQLLLQQNHKALVMTRSSGFSWPGSLKDILEFNPDCIWVTAGAGSVEAAKRDFRGAIETHVTLPIGILESVPKECKVVLFSSDYAADEKQPDIPGIMNPSPRSLYAATKCWMEQAARIINRPNSASIRISTVYGKHLYDKTFPGKVLNRYPKPTACSFPSNWVTPTPSKWIADVLVRNYERLFSLDQHLVHHVAPRGGTTVNAWAARILGEGYRVESKGFDLDRPLSSNLGCSLEAAPDWAELWNSSWWQ